MTRTPKAEAKRKLTLAETMYAKMLEKHRQAEKDYVAKIKRLQAEYEATA